MFYPAECLIEIIGGKKTKNRRQETKKEIKHLDQSFYHIVYRWPKEEFWLLSKANTWTDHLHIIFFPSIHPSKCLLMHPSMQSLGLAYELFPANIMSEATFALDRSSPQEWNIGMDNHLCKHLQELSKHGKMPRRETEQTEGRRANTVPERGGDDGSEELLHTQSVPLGWTNQRDERGSLSFSQ